MLRKEPMDIHAPSQPRTCTHMKDTCNGLSKMVCRTSQTFWQYGDWNYHIRIKIDQPARMAFDIVTG